MAQLLEPGEVASSMAAGGKAGNLALAIGDFRVPEFLVIDFSEEGELDAEAWHQLEAFLERVGGIVAVRSSANVEDAEARSFAGQFETRLGVTRTRLRRAVAEVRSSVHQQRVADYCAAMGVDAQSIRMSVVVQRQVNATSAGVALTQASDGGNVVIEAVYGLGELLVGGQQQGDRYVVNGDGEVNVEHVAYQPALLAYGEGGVQKRLVPAADRNAQKLTQEQASEVADLALAVQYQLGFTAADIEWCYDALGLLYLLQARPYASLAAAPSDNE